MQKYSFNYEYMGKKAPVSFYSAIKKNHYFEKF